MTASKSSHFPKGRKFPQALVAAGLAAALVGCGGGSDSAMTPEPAAPAEAPSVTAARTAQTDAKKYVEALTASSSPGDLARAKAALNHFQAAILNLPVDQRSKYNTEYLKLTGTLADQEAAIAEANAPDPLQAELASARGAQMTAEQFVNAVNNYSKDGDITAAKGTLVSFQQAISAISDPAERNTFRIRHGQLVSLLDDKEKARTELIDKNKKGHAWINTIEKFKANSPLSAIPGGAALRVQNHRGSTRVTLNGNAGRSTTSPGTGWTAREFPGSGGTTTKVFTSHSGLETSSYTLAELKTEHDNHNILGNAVLANAVAANSGVVHILSTTSLPLGLSDNVITIKGINGIAALNAVPAQPGTFSTQIHRSNILNLIGANGKFEPDAATNTDITLTGGTLYRVEFLGMLGNFVCATDCTIRFDPNTGYINGVYNTAAVDTLATLQFRPIVATGSNSINNVKKVSVMKPDLAYVEYGYWMNLTTYGIDTFARVSSNNDLATLGTIDGKATYEGSAAGVYVLNKGTSDKKDLYDGEFTASANITAYFGKTSEVPAGKEFSVHGMVEKFKDVDNKYVEDKDLETWKLSLESSTIKNDFSFSGSTDGGGGKGVWQGQFAGNASVVNPTADDHPEVVGGEFNGHFSNGHVIGAFGADLDTDG